MRKKNLLGLAVAAALGVGGMAQGAILINEIDSDTFNTPGTDYAEFIELYSTTGTTTSLNGLSLVLFNGNGDTSYGSISLDGLQTDSNGFFVLGTTSVARANNTTLLGAGNVLQNGADAVALYNGAAPTAATMTNLLDAIVYGTNDPADTALLDALGETTQFDEGAASPPSDEANRTLARVPSGVDGNNFVQAVPTPGEANVVPEPAALSLIGLAGLGLLRRRSR